MDTLPTPAPSRQSRTWWWILFAVASVVGFLAAAYFIPSYAPEVGKFYASSCADNQEFDTEDDCRATCTADPDLCFYKVLTGCWRVPNGVECAPGEPVYYPSLAISQGGGALEFGCANLSDRHDYSAEIPGDGNYCVQYGTFHNPVAGCGATTYEPGSGGIVDSSENGVLLAHWEPNLDVQCGRYQFDVRVTDCTTGEFRTGIGVVLTANTDCVASGGTSEPTPTPTETLTPTPTLSLTPTPTLTTTPTPTLSVTPTPTLSTSPTPTLTTTPSPTETLTPTPTLSVVPTVPLLSLGKSVRNVTQNSADTESVTATPEDTVEFLLRISSIGSGNGIGVVARDTLPVGLTYIPGSTTLDGIPAADGITSSGLLLGDMPPGRTIAVRFRALVAPASFFSYGTTVLTNVGYVRGLNVPEISDVAFVSVLYAPPSVSMSLVKMGRNSTRGEMDEHSPVYAFPAQTIDFILRVRNTSVSTLTNVVVRDSMPQGIVALAGSVRIGGISAPDTLAVGGLTIGTLAAGQEAVVVFSGRVVAASELPSGTTTVINTAQATATDVGTITAQLPIIITNSAVVIPPISTGPGETTLLALIISAMITLLYVGYTGTDVFRRREASGLAKQAKGDHDLFNFRA